MIYDKVMMIVEALNTAGVPATCDARDVNPPAAWVAADRVVEETLCLEPLITVNVVLVAPDHGTATALKALDAMLDKAMPALTGVCSSVEDISLSDTATLSGTGPLPAFTVTVTI